MADGVELAILQNREPPHSGICAQNLQTHGSQNVDDVTSITIFSADPVGYTISGYNPQKANHNSKFKIWDHFSGIFRYFRYVEVFLTFKAI